MNSSVFSKQIKRKTCFILAAVLLMSSFVFLLAACGNNDSSYADVKQAVNQLGKDNEKSNGKEYISFSFNQYCDDYAVEFDFDGDENNIVKTLCEAFIKKTKGMELPYIYIKTDENTSEDDRRNELVFETLKNLECKSAGLYWNWNFDIIPDFVTRVSTQGNAMHEDYPIAESVTELKDNGLRNDASYLKSFPNIEKLAYCGTMRPENIPELPSLKSINFYNSSGITARKNSFAETTYALWLKNPNIETVDDTPIDSYNWTEGFEEEDVKGFKASVQKSSVEMLDLDSFTKIKFDDAKLHGKIALVGYNRADSLSNFNAPDQYVSAELKKAFTTDMLKRDVIIKVSTVNDEKTSRYSNGATAVGMSVYVTIIDPTNKTISEENLLMHVGTPSTVKGIGYYYAELDQKDTWEQINKLYKEKYVN